MRLKTRCFFAILIIFSLAAPLAACGKKESNEIFKYDISSDPSSLDPQLADDYNSSLVLFNMYEGLLKAAPDGSLSAGVAKSYNVSDDGLCYTFYLRDDAKWENGKSVTAYDFEFAFKRLFDPQTNSPTAKDYYFIKNSKAIHEGKGSTDYLGVRAADTFVLQIILEYKSDMFLPLLTRPAAMPCNQEFFNETKGKYGVDAKQTLSNGPFSLKSWVHGDYLALIRNENYTSEDEKLIPAGLSFIVETEKAKYRFETEQTDAFIYSSKDGVGNKINISEYENTVWGITFNLKNKTLAKSDVRQALVYGFDRTSYQEHLPEYLESTQFIVPPVISLSGKNYREYANYSIFPQPDYKKAKKLLDSKSKSALNNMTLIAPEGIPHLQMFAYVSQIWQKELGVYIAVKSLPEEDYQKAIKSGDFDLAVVSIKADYDSPESVLSAFSSSSKKNYWGYSSKSYNSFLKEAKKALGADEAIKNFFEAEKLLINDGVFIPMYFQKEYFAVRKDTSGITYYPANRMIDFSAAEK